MSCVIEGCAAEGTQHAVVRVDGPGDDLDVREVHFCDEHAGMVRDGKLRISVHALLPQDEELN